MRNTRPIGHRPGIGVSEVEVYHSRSLSYNFCKGNNYILIIKAIMLIVNMLMQSNAIWGYIIGGTSVVQVQRKSPFQTPRMGI